MWYCVHILCLINPLNLSNIYSAKNTAKVNSTTKISPHFCPLRLQIALYPSQSQGCYKRHTCPSLEINNWIIPPQFSRSKCQIQDGIKALYPRRSQGCYKQHTCPSLEINNWIIPPQFSRSKCQIQDGIKALYPRRSQGCYKQHTCPSLEINNWIIPPQFSRSKCQIQDGIKATTENSERLGKNKACLSLSKGQRKRGKMP